MLSQDELRCSMNCNLKGSGIYGAGVQCDRTTGAIALHAEHLAPPERREMMEP